MSEVPKFGRPTTDVRSAQGNGRVRFPRDLQLVTGLAWQAPIKDGVRVSGPQHLVLRYEVTSFTDAPRDPNVVTVVPVRQGAAGLSPKERVDLTAFKRRASRGRP